MMKHLSRAVGFLTVIGLAVPCLAAAEAADKPALRGDVVARGDVLTLGELVEGTPAALADTPLFRAPALGQTGTVQVRRILDAAETLGLGPVDTRGRLQVGIVRSARQIGSSEIEAALKTALAAQVGFDPAATGIAFDGPPTMLVAPDVKGSVSVSDLVFDRRSRRVAATVWVGPSPTERRASLRVSGAAVETVEIAVMVRSVERGETVKPTDVSLERRPRDTVSSDVAFESGSLSGRVARRALSTGSVVRSGDLMKAEIVARGEIVTVVYEIPGIALSLRAKALESGAAGDVISVAGSGSKKTLQATIVAPGKVSVLPTPSSRVVAAAALPATQP